VRSYKRSAFETGHPPPQPLLTLLDASQNGGGAAAIIGGGAAYTSFIAPAFKKKAFYMTGLSKWTIERGF
jgi:hypothetical protein